jgi:hypothetical protein
MPIAVFFYCLFVKGLLFNGKAGLLYTLQRTIAEGILALFILENKLVPERAKAERGTGRAAPTGEYAGTQPASLTSETPPD